MSRVIIRILQNDRTRGAGHILAKTASISGHESGSRRRDHSRGRIMRAQRVWKPVRPVKKNAEIERLRLELAALNERIEELEKQHPAASKIEELRESPLVLAGKIVKFRFSAA